jgi:hypothetical protein
MRWSAYKNEEKEEESNEEEEERIKQWKEEGTTDIYLST